VRDAVPVLLGFEGAGLRWRVPGASIVAGYVEAKSNRPGEAPAINPRYVSEESDRAPSSAVCAFPGGCSPHRR
jgi:hypothetical protein